MRLYPWALSPPGGVSETNTAKDSVFQRFKGPSLGGWSPLRDAPVPTRVWERGRRNYILRGKGNFLKPIQPKRFGLLHSNQNYIGGKMQILKHPFDFTDEKMNPREMM